MTDPPAPDGAPVISVIEAVLDEFRPRLLADGAQLKLVHLDDAGCLQLRLCGPMARCAIASALLRECLAKTLRERVAGVFHVELLR